MKGLVLAALACGAALGAAPLENQDVVRMVVSRRPPGEIVDLIRAREVSFDLSEEMVAELRLAGVPELVLQAMRERQAQMEPAPAPAAVRGPERHDSVPLRVHLRSSSAEEGHASFFWFPDRVEEDMARALQLGPGTEERAVHDLAVFVACVTPEHVPDQWRSRSPLGRDFTSMPRHELLVLHAGATRADAREVPRQVRTHFPEPRGDEPPPGWLRLELPEKLETGLRAGEAHTILLGVAILAGDHYVQVGHAEKNLEALDPSGTDLKGRVLQGKSTKAPVGVEVE